MKKLLAIVAISALSASVLAAGPAKKKAKTGNPTVIIKTNKGTIVAELFADKAPITVKNFLRYVNEKAYDGTIFHRVIPGFMIQGGGYDRNFKRRPTHEPIKNEAKNGLKNKRGTLAMARTSVVDSATNQFFINLKDNSFLDHGVRDYGYAVFGRVVKGMDVVDAIAKVPTGARGPFGRDCPLKDVVIESIRVKK
ncbi:MAG: peptidyl-prolyl cis-trans isomerase [Deltaproteobacteria bacterium]|nr:MAG: peptidyl-prolyl cis-trans isomerase [Deltaproteobacteria bacterium]